jgi:hypothetical protein
MLEVFEDMADTQCHHQTLEEGWAMCIDAALSDAPSTVGVSELSGNSG